MEGRLTWLLARMTPRRRIVLGGFAAVPALAVIVLLAGVAVDLARPAAVVALGLLVLTAIAAAVVGVAIRRRLRRVRNLLDGESADLSRPSALVESGDPRLAEAPRAQFVGFGRSVGTVPVHMIAGFGMATRSPVALDLLAGLATAWRADAADLRAVFGATAEPSTVSLAIGRADPTTLLLFARTIAAVRSETGNLVADNVARFVGRGVEARTLSMSSRQWLLERLIAAGERDATARLLGSSATSMAEQLIAADVLNPFVGDGPDEPGPWLTCVNSIFRRAGLEGIRLTGTAAQPFDRLRGEPAGAVHGPLVSIIMTTYAPEPDALRTAIESVIGQSWRDWELVILDDASPDEHLRVVEAAAEADPRIRLIRSDSNAGTYVRRNEGIQAARGDYVTALDADDWMHPRRIEFQVRDLESRADALANLCRSVRVTSDLRFVQPRGTLLRLTEASLLFRREAVLESVGYFDTVRKAADTAFRHRLEAAVGGPVPIVDVEAPLMFSRFDDRSLSAPDLLDGWTHPARVAYSSANAAWIAAEQSAGRTPRLDFPNLGRPFPAPPALLGEPAPEHDVDVLYVLDVRDDRRRRRRHEAMEAEVLAAVEAGHRVGIRRLDALTETWIAPTTRRRLQDAVNAGRIIDVLAGEPVRARIAVVLDEPALLGAPVDGGLAIDRLLVVESAEPTGAGGVHWSRAETRSGAARLAPGARIEFVAADVARRAVAELRRG